MNMRWIEGLHSGNPDLGQLNFARLAERTGATKILAELRQSRSHEAIASNLVAIGDRKNSKNFSG